MTDPDTATKLAQARELGRLRVGLERPRPDAAILTPQHELVALLDALDRVHALAGNDESGLAKWQRDLITNALKGEQ